MRSHVRFPLLVMLALALVSVGCGLVGAKTADTPQNQAYLDAGAELRLASAEYIKTNTTYRAGCNPAKPPLTVADCNAYAAYWPTYQQDWVKADDDLRVAMATGDTKLAQDVRARASAMRSRLKTYTDKAGGK